MIRPRRWLIFFILAALESAAALAFTLATPSENASALAFGLSRSRLLMAAIPAGVFLLAAAVCALYISSLGWADRLSVYYASLSQKPAVITLLAWLCGLSAATYSGVMAVLNGSLELSYRLLPVLGLFCLLFLEAALFLGPGFKTASKAFPYGVLSAYLALTVYTAIANGQIVKITTPASGSDPITLIAVIEIFASFSLLLLVRLLADRDSPHPPPALSPVAWKPFVFSALFLLFLSAVGVAVGIQWLYTPTHLRGAGAPVLPVQLLPVLWAGLVLLFLSTISKPSRLAGSIQKIILPLGLFLLAACLWLLPPTPWVSYTQPSHLQVGEFYPYSDARTYDVSAQQMLLGYGLAGGQPLPRPLYTFFLGILHLILGQNTITIITAQTILLALLPVGIYLIGRRFSQPVAGVLGAWVFILREYNQINLSFTLNSIYYPVSLRMLMTEFFTALFLMGVVWVGARWLAKPTSPTLAALSGMLLGITALIRTQVLFLAGVLLVFGFMAVWYQVRRGVDRKTVWAACAWFLAGILLVTLPWVGRNLLRTGQLTFEEPTYATRIFTFASGGTIDTEDNSFKEIPGGEEPSLQRVVANLTNSWLSSLHQLPWGFNLDDDLWSYTRRGVQIPPYYPQLQITPTQAVWITLHILLVAAGMGIAFKKARLAGLLPLGIYAGYSLSSAVANFSGWRFILPVDWVILLYWGIGAAGCLQLLLPRGKSVPVYDPDPPAAHPAREWKPVVILLVALAAGLFLPLGEVVLGSPAPALKLDTTTLENQLSLAQVLAGTPPQPSALHAWLQQPTSQVLSGHGYYPTYLDIPNNFLRMNISGVVLPERPVLYIEVLDSQRHLVYLPVEGPPSELRMDGRPVVVMGCQQGEWLKAYVLLLPGETPQALYSRSPLPEQCAP